MQPALVLASSSPRRRELLGSLGLEFSVESPDVDETEPDNLVGDEAIVGWVRGLAAAKADAVAARHASQTWILAADTTVVLDGRVLGKPIDDSDAVAMLQRLQGRTHQVITAVALRTGGATQTGWLEHSTTQVTFYPCSDEQLREYVATGESADKAGAYAAQGRGALIIQRLEGCYFNVVGLPISLVGRLLVGAGFDLWSASSGQ